jgi:hypothetical protein
LSRLPKEWRHAFTHVSALLGDQRVEHLVAAPQAAQDGAGGVNARQRAGSVPDGALDLCASSGRGGTVSYCRRCLSAGRDSSTSRIHPLLPPRKGHLSFALDGFAFSNGSADIKQPTPSTHRLRFPPHLMKKAAVVGRHLRHREHVQPHVRVLRGPPASGEKGSKREGCTPPTSLPRTVWRYLLKSPGQQLRPWSPVTCPRANEFPRTP